MACLRVAKVFKQQTLERIPIVSPSLTVLCVSEVIEMNLVIRGGKKILRCFTCVCESVVDENDGVHCRAQISTRVNTIWKVITGIFLVSDVRQC